MEKVRGLPNCGSTDALRSLNDLNKIITLLPGNIYWKDRNGIYQGCNSNLSKILGLKGPEFIKGKINDDLMEKKLADQTTEIDLLVMSENKEIIVEEVGVDTYGKEVIYLTTKTPLHDKKGKVIGLLGVSIDITDRKKAEKALEEAKEKAEAADKAKTEFLENMRHDIRTPLSGIVGFADIIKHDAKEPVIREYAENLAASGNALLNFLNEVLEAIQVASGNVPLLKKKFDLKAKLLEVVQLNQPKAKAKKLELSFDYDPKIPAYLIGDPKRVQRIVLELISNALNFTKTGYVKVSAILAKSEEDQKRVVKIIVKDSGVGFDPAQKEEIFLRFKMLNAAYEGIYKGAGLGLAVVKQFMDDIKGEIYVDSKLGKGSSFMMVIPFQEPLLDEPLEAEDTSEAESIEKPAAIQKLSSRHKLRKMNKTISKGKEEINPVLVIEDDSIAADVVRAILEGLHCQVDIATNGQKALELFKKNAYDLIFMDIGLPDIDGYQVTKRIRALEWRKENQIPIIALSAHTGVESKQLCIDAGMNAVLTKPLARNKAEDMLNAFIPSRSNASVAESAQPAITTSAEAKNDDLLMIQEKIFDPETTAETIGLKSEMIHNMFKLFLKGLEKDLPELVSGYEKKNWMAVKEMAHKLKGSSVYSGAMRVHQASSRLENYIEEHGATKMTEALYQQLLKEIEVVKKEAKKQEAA